MAEEEEEEDAEGFPTECEDGMGKDGAESEEEEEEEDT